MILQEKVNERDVPTVLDDLQSGPRKGPARRSARPLLGVRWSYSGGHRGGALAHGGADLCRRDCTVAYGIDSIRAGAGVPGGAEAAKPTNSGASSRSSAVATDASNAVAAHHDCSA
jgi:hypothetical protein